MGWYYRIAERKDSVVCSSLSQWMDYGREAGGVVAMRLGTEVGGGGKLIRGCIASIQPQKAIGQQGSY